MDQPQHLTAMTLKLPQTHYMLGDYNNEVHPAHNS